MREKANEMDENKFDRLGPMMGAIGEEATNIVGDPDGLYIYVEIGNQWISASVFKEEDGIVRYFDPSSELSDVIWDAWEAEEEDKRWPVMEYEVHGTKFSAKFKFPDEVDVESFDVDRREEALKRRYGDKPIVYPPVPEHFMELK